MGGIFSDSMDPPAEEMAYLKSLNLEDAEVRKLYKRFRQLSGNRDYLTPEDLLPIHEVMVNAVSDRVIRVFTRPTPGDLFPDRISFRKFAQTIAVFHPSTDAEVKLRLAFTLYDNDGSGTVDHEEMFDVLRKLTPDSMGDSDVRPTLSLPA